MLCMLAMIDRHGLVQLKLSTTRAIEWTMISPTDDAKVIDRPATRGSESGHKD